jgi:hypothetical protein
MTKRISDAAKATARCWTNKLPRMEPDQLKRVQRSIEKTVSQEVKKFGYCRLNRASITRLLDRLRIKHTGFHTEITTDTRPDSVQIEENRKSRLYWQG